jgi:hypothetical protein
LKPLTFGDAVEVMKNGRKVARRGWNGKNMWLKIQYPDENSKMTLPYIYIEYPVGHPSCQHVSKVPWFASQTDMLSDDWVIDKNLTKGLS